MNGYLRNNPLNRADPDGHCGSIAECIPEFVRNSPVIAPVMAVLGPPVVAGALVSASARAMIVRTANVLVENAADREHLAVVESIVAVENARILNCRRPGSRGNPDHQQTGKEEAERRNGKQEVTIPTTGGFKEKRRADAVGTNPETGAIEIVQVYRPTPAGNIPKREREAAQDIQNATGVKPTMVPVRPLPPSS